MTREKEIKAIKDETYETCNLKDDSKDLLETLFSECKLKEYEIEEYHCSNWTDFKITLSFRKYSCEE